MIHNPHTANLILHSWVTLERYKKATNLYCAKQGNCILYQISKWQSYIMESTIWCHQRHPTHHSHQEVPKGPGWEEPIHCTLWKPVREQGNPKLDQQCQKLVPKLIMGWKSPKGLELWQASCLGSPQRLAHYPWEANWFWIFWNRWRVESLTFHPRNHQH